MELLFSPAFHTVTIDAKADRHELPLSEAGSCTLPEISPRADFVLVVDGSHLCETSRHQLEELEAGIAVVEAKTALRAYDFRPSGETSVFYRNDREIVLLVRYEQVIHDCPVVISWYKEAELIYSEVVLLPRQEQPGGERVHGRSEGTCLSALCTGQALPSTTFPPSSGRVGRAVNLGERPAKSTFFPGRRNPTRNTVRPKPR